MPQRREALPRLVWLALVCLLVAAASQQLRASKAPSLDEAKTTNVKLDLNKAAAHDFALLPGVGPVLANRLVEHRIENGRYDTVDELREVKGVGERTLQRLQPWVFVESQDAARE